MSNIRIVYFAFLLLLITLFSTAAIADVTISGVVHDVEGQPLKQIVVTAPDQGLRAYTDESGKFSLQLKTPTDSLTLVFDSPCCYSETTTFNLKGTTSLDVAL